MFQNHGTTPKPQPAKLLDQVRGVIRARHYSLRTEEAYVRWMRRFILFHGKRHPREMGVREVQQFLTHLAVEGRVAASTRSQALSALLFLYMERREAWNSFSSTLRPYRACVKVRWDHTSMRSPRSDVIRATRATQLACSSDWRLTSADGSCHAGATHDDSAALLPPRRALSGRPAPGSGCRGSDRRALVDGLAPEGPSA